MVLLLLFLESINPFSRWLIFLDRNFCPLIGTILHSVISAYILPLVLAVEKLPSLCKTQHSQIPQQIRDYGYSFKNGNSNGKLVPKRELLEANSSTWLYIGS